MSRGSAAKSGRREERLRRKAERAALMTASADQVEAGGSGAVDAGSIANSANVPPSPPPSGVEGGSEYEQYGALTLYKPGQGYWVRMGTAVGMGIMSLLLAQWLYSEFSMFPVGLLRDILLAGGPIAALTVGGWGIWRVVGRSRRAVDFFIATEGEMKKVNWSTRKEVIASTKVVLMVTVLIMLLLLVVDTIFRVLFFYLHVLRIPPFPLNLWIKG